MVKLYYTNPDSADASILVNRDGYILSMPLAKGRGLKILTINNAKPVHAIQLAFLTSAKLYVFGANFDDTTGVYVDDFDMRGSSGQQLSVLDAGLMQQFQADMNIKCIVLQYGINVVHSGTDDYSYYSRGFVNTINSLKLKLPKCGILVNSVSDRATKKQDGYQTMPEIPGFVVIQQAMAKQTNTAFWNLFEAMGGDSSMINMVNSPQSLANKDYTHFKPSGGTYIASYFYYSMLYAFEKYEWAETHKNERS